MPRDLIEIKRESRLRRPLLHAPRRVTDAVRSDLEYGVSISIRT